VWKAAADLFLQIFADSLQVDLRLDSERSEQGRVANAGLLEKDGRLANMLASGELNRSRRPSAPGWRLLR
jgi:hypothetical protein